MTLRNTFLEATLVKKDNEKREYLDKPEKKLYDQGKIDWSRYIKLEKERLTKEKKCNINDFLGKEYAIDKATGKKVKLLYPIENSDNSIYWACELTYTNGKYQVFINQKLLKA